MKKFATMLLALLLTAALTVPAMATFTPSSENKDAPEIISATFEDGTDAKGYLIVTPYSKRNSADPSIKESLERAYEDVKNASTLDKLNSDVNTLLKNYPHVKAEDPVRPELRGERPAGPAAPARHRHLPADRAGGGPAVRHDPRR